MRLYYPTLTQAEIESVRELLDFAPELLEMAAFRRAEQASIAASNRLGRGDDRIERRLVFRPPAETQARGQHGSLRFGVPVGVTVLRSASGEWTETTTPTSTEIDQASRAFLGGHIHLVTEEEAAELFAAGYAPEWLIRDNRGQRYEKWQPEKEEINGSLLQ